MQGSFFCSYSSYSSRAVRSRDRSGRFPFSVSLRRRDIIPAALGPFRVLYRNGCRSGCPEGVATAYVRTCVNPALRSPSAECSGRSAGCPGIGIFRDLFQRGCLWDPFVFFRPLVRFGAQYPSVCPVCRPVGCMRRTPECPSILPVSSRSPDRTDMEKISDKNAINNAK